MNYSCEMLNGIFDRVKFGGRLFALVILVGAFLTAGVAVEAQKPKPKPKPASQTKPPLPPKPPYQYYRVGNAQDAQVKPQAGYALLGGGEDLDEAFVWLCGRAHGGDLLVLRSSGTDAYNPYIQKLCHLNSVATIVIGSREAANDPFVAAKIREAHAIFISGGDQSTYINFWMGTPVQAELNKAIECGVPVGGTSAGLAVLGEWAYTAQGDKPNDKDLDSKTALTDPFHPRVTLVKGFLTIPILKGVITDTHFATRDRMGRLLVFLARLNVNDAKIRGIGVEQTGAVLLEPNGEATVVGHGSAYFIEPLKQAEILKANKPLSFLHLKVQTVPPGHGFNVMNWSGDEVSYSVVVRNGELIWMQNYGWIY
jgi:cyanophycinase